MSTSDRESILHKIADAERQIESLNQQREKVEATLRSLRQRLTLYDDENPRQPTTPATVVVSTTTNLTPGDKVALFLRLFRGRDDVYPKLWQNQKTGKKGYSPACANEWVRGVCEKPRVKCGECPNQAFLPLTAETVLDHLQGRHVIGVYPMLKDETCWFLAADFDKEAWREDVLAFVETCRRIDVPYAIERSRSGNGAHVWLFFSSPVAAATARKRGSYLITETMSRRHQLSMASYDRLIPNQDTLPKGGFGNLIALPLQYHPRQKGNTVFLNDALEPSPGQWDFLASLVLIPAEKVERIATEAATRGQVIGLQFADAGEHDIDASPWLKAPSRKPKHTPIVEPIPRQVRGVLSQRLYVERAGLPSALINQIKRLAAFQNPEFYKKQNLRLSTALTPRVISCAEDHGKHISLPRGCLDDVQTLLQRHKSHLELEDLRYPGDPIEVTFLGQLTDGQRQAAKVILEHETGVMVAPPGFGKTVLGTYLIAQRKYNTLILVHRQPLLEQWRSQIGIFLGQDAKAIGQIGAGKRKLTGQIDVAMIQSLSRKDSVDDIVAEYGQVIIDECHHLPAVSFERVLSEAKARYVVGLTATPQRRDGHQPIIHMQIGPVRFNVDPRSQVAQRPFDHRLVVRVTGFDPPVDASDTTIQQLYGQLHRLHPGKREVRIIDYVDGKVPMLARMFERRRVGYRAMGYREGDNEAFLE